MDAPETWLKGEKEYIFAVLANEIIVIAVMHVKCCPVRIRGRLNSRLKNH